MSASTLVPYPGSIDVGWPLTLKDGERDYDKLQKKLRQAKTDYERDGSGPVPQNEEKLYPDNAKLVQRGSADPFPVLDHDFTQYFLKDKLKISDTGFGTSEVKSNPGTETDKEFFFYYYIHVVSGTLLVKEIERKKKAPLHASEAMYYAWKRAAVTGGVSIDSLRRIIIYDDISTSPAHPDDKMPKVAQFYDGRAIVYHALQGAKLDEHHCVIEDLKPETDKFRGVLETGNCQVVLRFLKDHVISLGRLNITSITVFQGAANTNYHYSINLAPVSTL